MWNFLKSKYLLIGLSVTIVVCLVVVAKLGKPKCNVIRIVTPPSIIASLPHWVAEDQDFYRKADLKVRTINVTSSQVMADAISGGDGDILPAVSLYDVINNQLHALDRPVIFSHSRMRSALPFESVFVLANSPIKSPKDLEGKRIAVYNGATASEYLRVYLTEHGVDVSKIKFKTLKPPEHIPALQQGDVDASHLYDPHRSMALQGGLCREIIRGIYPSFNEPSAIGCSAVSARFAQEQPLLLDKYLGVWDRSIKFIREKPENARAILAKKLNIPLEVARNATWVDATLTDELDAAAIRSTINTLNKMGLVPKDFDASSTSYILERP